MAIKSGFLQSLKASVVQGTSTIIITDSIDCSFVSSGTAIFLGNNPVVEGIQGLAPDLSGKSTITLRKPWIWESVTDVELTAFNTIEGLRDAIRMAREIAIAGSAQESAFADFVTGNTEQIELMIAGAKYPVTPYAYLSKAVIAHLKEVASGRFMDGGTF